MVASSQLISFPLCQILSVFWMAIETPSGDYISIIADGEKLSALSCQIHGPCRDGRPRPSMRPSSIGPQPLARPPRPGAPFLASFARSGDSRPPTKTAHAETAPSAVHAAQKYRAAPPNQTSPPHPPLLSFRMGLKAP